MCVLLLAEESEVGFIMQLFLGGGFGSTTVDTTNADLRSVSLYRVDFIYFLHSLMMMNIKQSVITIIKLSDSA